MRRVRIEFFAGSMEDVKCSLDKYENIMESYLIVDDNFKKFNPLDEPEEDMSYRVLMFARVGMVLLIELSKEIDKDFIAICDDDTGEVIYCYS